MWSVGSLIASSSYLQQSLHQQGCIKYESFVLVSVRRVPWR